MKSGLDVGFLQIQWYNVKHMAEFQWVKLKIVMMAK